MSLLFFDGFETYATADILKEWSDSTGTVAINASGGRRGGGALYAPDNTSLTSNVTKVLASAVSTIVIGFAFNPSSTPTLARNLARLRDGASNQLEIKFNTNATLSISRNGTVLGTSVATVDVASDQYLELKATIHDTAGSFELRKNGVNILSASGVDTKNTTNASVSQVSFGTDGNPGSSTWKYDDLYILDTSGSSNNDFLGDIRIDAIYPNADGNYTDWTPSAGTDHYALVDEATPNTTDYVSSSTAGQKDSFAMASPPVLASELIFGVRVKVAALKDDAGERSIKVGVRSGVTDSVSADQALSTSQLYYSNIHETDPDTGVAWTPAGIDGMQALIEAV